MTLDDVSLQCTSVLLTPPFVLPGTSTRRHSESWSAEDLDLLLRGSSREDRGVEGAGLQL